MQKFLHFLYTVVAILFVNALFQTLESAVSISGIASVVYSAAKCVIFLITIAASVAIFRAKFKQVKEESSQNSRIAEPATKNDCTKHSENDCVEVNSVEDLQEFCEEHPLIDDFLTKVKGVTFRNDDGTSRQEILSYCLRGESVYFRQFIYNGKPAYAVISNHGQIGSLSADLAESFDSRYGRDAYISGTISDITGGEDGMYYGCMLHIRVYKG